MAFALGPRRATFVNIAEESAARRAPLTERELAHFEKFDLIYRSLCALLYNYVPTSGHPGGSVSSGRIVQGVLFDALDYDAGSPLRDDADRLTYAAGHKALGLYAMWALRHEVLRVGAPELLPTETRLQLRLEDLLGFRRNPIEETPLFRNFGAKALDGHPTPATPFVPIATGASGVGVPTSIGLALGARDHFGARAPRVHILEGEGGLTPGRVAEALAAAATARLDNVILHVDWNQSSIDSDRVCREGQTPGDYVQWDPAELFYLHDWNVILVPEGLDFQQVFAAQRRAAELATGQPTAVVYRTVKGWRYGIEGRGSHGAGHKLCSDGFYEALSPLMDHYQESLMCCPDPAQRRCDCPDGGRVIEECFWDALQVVRRVVERETEMVGELSRRLVNARERLDGHGRAPRDAAPQVERIHELAGRWDTEIPPELKLEPGKQTTLRGELGRVLNHYNRASRGAIFTAAADLVGSTSVNVVAEGFPAGFFNAVSNPDSRLLSVGGICEDAISAVLCGLAANGRHSGVASSYGAFIAALGHVAVRLHAIGSQAKRELTGEPGLPVFLVCAHAGLKTGEDGPTHADPQPLQLLQENFPRGAAITLTPWDPQELWPLVTAALLRRPALIAPFVTRPTETVPDREALGLAPATDAASGVYRLRAAEGTPEATLVLQGSEVALAFVEQVLPRLAEHGVDLEVYYVASAELFDLLPDEQQQAIFPEASAGRALGITGFTLPTMFRWIRTDRGRSLSLHPFRRQRFLGSGPGEKVLREAGLDGESQLRAILEFVRRPVITGAD